jgi:hypothetical protein
MAIVYGANYGRPTLDLNFAKNKSLIDTVSGQNLVTFSRAQANYLTTYVGADGLIKTASANEPRFDHNPLTGECLGLLIEESRSNNQSSSNVFSSGWNDLVAVTLQNNLYPDPIGTNTATRIIPTTTSTSHYIGRYQEYSTAAYAHSVFLKPAGYSRVLVDVNGSTFTAILSGSGSFTNNNSITYATKIQAYSNGWYRLEWIWNNAGGGGANTLQPRITILDNSGNSTFAGDGVSGIDFFGYQQEVGLFCTSYIPTSGSTVTRSADVMSITGTNFSRWYNNTEGTFFTNAILAFTQNAGNPFTFGGVFYTAVTTRLDVSTLGNAPITGGLSNSLTSFSKTAVALKSGDFAIGRGGSITGSSSTVYTPTGTEFRINSSLGSLALINRLTYYPTRLQNYQLQQLTK